MHTTNSFGFTTLSRQGPLDISDQTELQGQQFSPAEKPLKNPTMAPLGSYGFHYGPITVPNPRPPNPRPAPKPQPAPTPVPAPKPQPAPTPVSHNQPIYLPNPRPPNPRPAPKPQPAPTPVSHKQPGHALWNEAQIRPRAEAELTKVKRAIQEVVAREFKIPGPALIRMGFRLSPTDVDDKGKWSFHQGRLWHATGRSLWAPMLVIWLPEREVPEGRTRALRAINGLSSADRENLARAARIEQAVRYGKGLERYPESSRRVLEGLPVPADGEMVHCGLEFRFGLTDIYPLRVWPTLMYLPVANWQVTIPLYERVVVRGEMDKMKLSSWAAKWNIEL
ncbi:hypothetical protein F4776DRAFT_675977 [Hypoxylon sp. NC0597]|nr:hypothetical protein F4776DRAFT_675977 [Hypoxylon sp. NC0597]